jgi:hypothetical protein
MVGKSLFFVCLSRGKRPLFFIPGEVQTPNKDAGQQNSGEYPEDIPRGQKVAHISSLQPCRQRRFAPKYRPIALS